MSLEPYRLDIDETLLVNAYHLARISTAIHRKDEDLWTAMEASFDYVHEFQRDWVDAMVVADTDHVVLAFRGADEEREIFEGFSYGQTSVAWTAGRVHRGLAESLDLVWADTLASFYDAQAYDKTLWLTGHSMGGSLAALSTLRLTHAGLRPTLTVTFGAPRVMDPIAAATVDTPFFRFVNNEDIVANFRWPSLFGTYEHPGEEIRLLASGRFAESRHAAPLARKIDRALSIGEGTLPAGPVHDHLMIHYLEKLQAHVHCAPVSPLSPSTQVRPPEK